MKLKQWNMILETLKDRLESEQRIIDALRLELNGFDRQLMEADTPNEERDIAAAAELAKTKLAHHIARKVDLVRIISEIEDKEF